MLFILVRLYNTRRLQYNTRRMLFSSTSSECHIIEHVIIVAFVYRHLNCRVNFFFFCFHFRSHSIFDVRVKRVGQISGVTFASKMHKNWYKSPSWMEFVLLLLVILNIAFVYSFNRLLHFFYTDILITFSPNQSGWRRFSCCIRDSPQSIPPPGRGVIWRMN